MLEGQEFHNNGNNNKIRRRREEARDGCSGAITLVEVLSANGSLLLTWQKMNSITIITC